MVNGLHRRSDRAQTAAAVSSGSDWKRFLPLVVVVAGLATAYALGWQRYLDFDVLVDSREALGTWVAAHPLLAPILFFFTYAAAVALSFPAASILSIFGGFLFGWLLGGVLVAAAATLGATLVFLAAKSALGGSLRRQVKGRAENLAQGFEQNAFGYLLALRLAPVFPFFIINIAPALFDVGLRVFVTATAIGILPGVFAYTYLGAGLEDAIAQAQRAGTSLEPKDLVTPELTLAFGLLAVVALVPVLFKKWKARRSQ
ncbi:TVP38/TMEM64 family protein [Tianweitania sediminis]|uniref:TVP38/TMEM64 family protein n=1 Tax=Tianweitania sediminis TaxID=1502156 RepID=UPI001FD8036E|nr:TVP38/TMEM64 family protein [Tianweitania sediminis]